MHDGYELLDVGDGRRLERFGGRLVDRPFPAADDLERAAPARWDAAQLVFERDRRGGRWSRGADLGPWPVPIGGLTLEGRVAPAGQVGIFPEHAARWPVLGDEVATATAELGRPPNVLVLFGYTGGATLALARAGARVAHVDASRPAIGWARRNAELSGLADAPVRWLVDDVRAIVAREIRRGNAYDGVLLDPPSYGHGPEGAAWRIERDLAPLLRDLAVLARDPALVLLTAHTPGWDADRLARLVSDTWRGSVDADPLSLTTADGRTVELGAYARRVR